MRATDTYSRDPTDPVCAAEGPQICSLCQKDRETLSQLFIERDKGAVRALKGLAKAATEVAKLGAQPGSQWHDLIDALRQAQEIIKRGEER